MRGVLRRCGQDGDCMGALEGQDCVLIDDYSACICGMVVVCVRHCCLCAGGLGCC